MTSPDSRSSSLTEMRISAHLSVSRKHPRRFIWHMSDHLTGLTIETPLHPLVWLRSIFPIELRQPDAILAQERGLGVRRQLPVHRGLCRAWSLEPRRLLVQQTTIEGICQLQRHENQGLLGGRYVQAPIDSFEAYAAALSNKLTWRVFDHISACSGGITSCCLSACHSFANSSTP